MDSNDKSQAQGGQSGFDALDVAIAFVESVAPAIKKVHSKDRSLADQARRAAQSIVLNVAEGRRRCGGDRRQCFHIASGSGEETRAALRVARAWGYVSDAEIEGSLGLLDRVLAMLWRLGRG